MNSNSQDWLSGYSPLHSCTLMQEYPGSDPIASWYLHPPGHPSLIWYLALSMAEERQNQQGRGDEQIPHEAGLVGSVGCCTSVTNDIARIMNYLYL